MGKETIKSDRIAKYLGIAIIIFLVIGVLAFTRVTGILVWGIYFILLIGLIITWFNLTSSKRKTQNLEHKGNKVINKIQAGISCLVLGGGIGVWVFARFTSLAGKLCSWQPPFSKYEYITFLGGAISLLLISIGARNLTKKS